jgi:hypothetical protein
LSLQIHIETRVRGPPYTAADFSDPDASNRAASRLSAADAQEAASMLIAIRDLNCIVSPCFTVLNRNQKIV